VVHKGLLLKIIAIVLVLLFLLAVFLLWQRNGREGAMTESEKVTIVASFSLQSSGGKDILNGITLALEEADYMAGDVEITLVSLDDGNKDGVWQGDLEEDNAEVAVADRAVVAYVGPFNSGAAEVSMPILNSGGIVQISPGNMWPGLTKEGFLLGEPDKFYPTGLRHYVRVVPADDFQGSAGTLWAKELGFQTIYIVDDGEAYGKGIADLFQERAEDLGMIVLGHKTIDKTSTYFAAEVTDIRRFNPDLVYYGGITGNGVTYLLRQMRAAGVSSAFMGPDGILGSDFISKTGTVASEGAYVTIVGALALDVGTPEAERYRRIH